MGKSSECVPFEIRFIEAVAEAGYILLPIEPETALRAGRLTASHGDPFDRIIAAQDRDLGVDR